jgi:hypothetical protein
MQSRLRAYMKDRRVTNRTLVLHKQPYSMRPSFGELLHNFNKIDRAEKVTPRKVGDQINFFFDSQSIWKDYNSRNRLPGGRLRLSFDDV